MRIDTTIYPAGTKVIDAIKECVAQEFTTTRDAITWKSYLAFRLPFGVTVAVGREWR